MLSTAVIDMYAKCGMIRRARQVFDGLLTRDIISWNVLIRGYAQHGEVKELFVFRKNGVKRSSHAKCGHIYDFA